MGEKAGKNSWRSLESSSSEDGGSSEGRRSRGLIETIAELQGQIKELVERDRREQSAKEQESAVA